MLPEDKAINSDAITDANAPVVADAEQANNPVAETVMSERESKMAALMDNHAAHEQSEPSTEVIVEEGEEGVDNPDSADAPLSQQAELPPGLKLNDKGEWVQTLKVDGVEIEQPYQQYQAQAQKYAAGDARLQQSVEFQKTLTTQEVDLKAWEERLKSQETQISTTLSSQSPPPSTDAVSDEAIENEATTLVEALFAGNEQEARDALKIALRNNRNQVTPAVDPAELAEQASNIALQRIEQRERDAAAETSRNELGSAFTEFATAYPDIVSNQALFNMADTETDSITAEHPEWTPSQVMAEAGDRIRSMVKSSEPQGEPTPNADLSNDRLKHKANLQPIPSVRTSATHAMPVDKQEDTSPAGVLSQMRQGRRGLRNEF